jgi:hypothetical protein
VRKAKQHCQRRSPGQHCKLEAYLGRRSAAQVLAGRLRRETGETIPAVLLYRIYVALQSFRRRWRRKPLSTRSARGSTASPGMAHLDAARSEEGLSRSARLEPMIRPLPDFELGGRILVIK